MSIKNFNRAAHQYENASQLQKQLAISLATTIKNKTNYNDSLLDFGCGTGFLLKQLPEYKRSGLEYCPNFLKISKQNLGSSVNFFSNITEVDQRFDIIVSNLTLQWIPFFADLPKQISQILSSRGRLLFSMTLPNSFKVLRKALRRIDFPNRIAAHHFPESHDITSSFLAYFDFQNIQFHQHTLTFENSLQVLQHFKKTGTQGHMNNQIWTKSTLRNLDVAFQELADKPILDYYVGTWELVKKASS